MTEIPTFPPVKKSPPPLIIVVVASVIGGMFGTLALFSLFPEYRLAEIPPGVNSVVLERPGKVVVEEEARINDLYTQAAVHVGEIFSAKSIGQNPQEATWFEGQIQGYATILTSDGYFVSVDGVVEEGDYIRVKDNFFEIIEVVSDPSSDLVFGRGEVSGLSTPTLAAHKELRPGMSAIGVLSDRGVLRTTISNLAHNSTTSRSHYLNSDYVELHYLISNESGLSGLPYFDMSGSLIGVKSNNTNATLIPSYVVESGLGSYIDTGKVVRNKANLQYISVPGRVGVKIFRRLSEGGESQLLLDDVIRQINGDDLTDDPHSFPQIFQSLDAEDEIFATVLREGDEVEIPLSVSVF